jgi:UDP-N-acetylmuramoylalanine--D-glutamate ligase
MKPFDQFAADYHDKQVLIFGLGLQGRGVGDTEIFAQIGARVTVTDQKPADKLADSISKLQSYPITYHLGGHRPEDILSADVIVRNASIPWNHPMLELAREKNIPIHMDETLFFHYAKPQKTLGVTGTRGKSTTTALIYELLKANQIPVILAGNIVPEPSLSLLVNYDPDKYYLFELSSWQLQGFALQRISPHLAVVTNIYPDHLLDRTLEEYIQDKEAIFQNQQPGDYLIINRDNPHTQILASRAKANITWFDKHSLPAAYHPILKGDHNLENLAAAYQVGKILNLDQLEQPLTGFSGLPFRQEVIGNSNGITVINDSTSTTPTACLKAINTYPGSILIIGGTTKKLPLIELVPDLHSKTKAIIMLPGSGTQELLPLLGNTPEVQPAADLSDAINQAFNLAGNGDTILFSPAFTSFGQFDNEFDRGRQFNQLIKQRLV